MMTTYVQYAIFGLLALVTIIGAIKVVLTRSIIHAAFWLFPVFAGMAGFYLYLNAQFLASIQVLIYIGAILVLIVFAVTLTRNASDPNDSAQTNRFVVPMMVAALALLAALAAAMPIGGWAKMPVKNIEQVVVATGAPVTDASSVGVVLLQQYMLPFEIASVLLLAAMVSAIVLARKERTVTTAPVEQKVTVIDEPEDAREPAEV